MRTDAPAAGIAPVLIVIAVGVLFAGAWAAKPALFGGASKRASDSSTATQKLEQAQKEQSSAAAASIQKVGEVVATLPPSPARDFMGREIPVALSLLPTPDPMKLLEAERRRAAVMEGRALEAEKLYANSAKEVERITRERDEALANRRAVDLELEKAAAAEHARTLQLAGAGLICLLVLFGWIWARVYSIHPELIGKIAADIRQGVHPIQAIDTYLAPRFHATVEKVARLSTPLPPAPKPASADGQQ